MNVAVEYDCRNERRRKEFACPYAARRFYVSKFKAGKNPKVRACKTAYKN